MEILAADSMISHYRIISPVGEGGMGTVYLARDTTLDRRVAIKVLRKIDDDGHAQELLRREARTAATLDHPNICSIYEIGESLAGSFIAMQYIEGETLADKIGDDGLGVDQVVALAVSVAEALAEAHHHGVIHRDIKPANIMIDRKGRPKVLDFGLAKVIESGSEEQTARQLTREGLIRGTVAYMSPEQTRGESLNCQTDIWSFGVVLYEMLSGHRPFEAESTAEIISLILTAEPPPLAKASSSISPRLASLVRTCLEKNLERRYKNMDDVAAEFGRIRNEYHGQPVSAGEAKTLSFEAVSTGESTPMTTEPAQKHPRPFNYKLASLLTAAGIIISVAIYTYPRWSPALLPSTQVGSARSQAYDQYIRGKVKVSSESRENNEAAIKLLEQAVAIDPNYAEAYAALARAYNIKSIYLAPIAEKKKLSEDAEVAIEKALALNPELAEAHLARGLILWTHAKGFPHERTIQSYKRAIVLNPSLDEAHHQLATVYFHIGLFEKAKEELEKTLTINPNNTLARMRTGTLELYQAHNESALKIFKSIPREANPALSDRAMSTALFQLGRTDEAAAVVDRYLAENPADEGGAMTSVKAMLFARAGKAREAEEAIQRSIEIGKDFGHFHHTTYDIAIAYALLNKPEDAVKWLDITADDGFPCYPMFEVDANFKGIRGNPQFIAFMTKQKAQWDRYKTIL